MTEGHRLAIGQLRAIAEQANGALEVLEVADQPNKHGWLHVRVSLDCSDKKPGPGGVALKRREWFTIGIPGDFPYKLPEIWTAHTRFAGLPHVQWKRHLCLYQAPATEWNVNDGMFGYLSRLDVWLDHAALGQLNPSGEPLHPPVAYLPDEGPRRVVIPRADTPPVGPANWLGFARLDKLSDTRADITAWIPIDELGDEAPIAPAFLLSQPMPYEFPKNMGDLFSELAGRGLSLRLLVAVLRMAVLFNREDDPLYVVLGTPMRGVAGSGDVKYHLAVWYVAPELVSALRLSLKRFDPNPRIREIGEQVEQVATEWLKLTDVGWCLLREDRPEIVVPRDRDSAVSWFRGRTVSLWGCGAIGSHLAEFLTRAGARKLVLWDNGIVTPGILARQLFTDEDIGQPKVKALASRLRCIRPGIEIEEHVGNLLSGPLTSDDWTNGADVVIESTGSGAVMTKMESIRHRTQKRTAFISMALGHNAERAMMLIASAAYSGGPLDIDRKLRQECYRRPELNQYTEEFWPKQARTDIFQPEPGCSDATFMGSCADVAVLSAAMLNAAAGELRAEMSRAVAHLFAQGGELSAPAKPQKRFAWPTDRILEDPASGYEVRVNSVAWRELTGWIGQNDRTRGAAVETGGLLFGERSDLLKLLWIDEVSGPPPDSIRSAAGFICGIQGTAELAREKLDRTRGQLTFLGMWHTHPSGLPLPSSTDLRAVEQLVQATGSPRDKSFMLIVGGGGVEQYTAAAYLFASEDFERIRTSDLTRECNIHVTRGEDLAHNVGLALSGGGSRAIAFHLGCLRALHDRGVLDQVRVISSVSGGSVIGAMYAYRQGTFADFEAKVTALLRRGLQKDILLKLANPAVGASVLGTAAVAGTAAIGADIARFALGKASSTFGFREHRVLRAIKDCQPPFRRRASTTTAYEAVLRDQVFGSIPITTPRPHDMQIVLNTCELRSGSAFRFGSRESGCWRYGTVADNTVEVAHAVAASAAYPALLPALDEVITFTDRNGKKRDRRVLLTDGGVYDNLGVTCLEPGSAAEVGYNRFAPDYIICCDAGQGIFQDHPVPYLWGPRMMRAFESVFRKAQNATVNRLHMFAASDQIKGFVLAYLGQIDNRLPYAPADLVSREQVFEYPTDFGAMDDEHIDRLSRRGEQLTNTLLAYYCPEL